MTTSPALDPRVEFRRRLDNLLVTVPKLLNAHLRPVLGWRRYVFILRLFASAGRYKKAFARPQDDASLRGVKQTFLLVGALYNELAREAGPQQALDTTQAFLYDLGCSVQRKAYFVGAT